MLIVVEAKLNMKKLVLLILSAFCLSWSSGAKEVPSEEKGLFLYYHKVKSEKDETLKVNEAVFTFTFNGIIDDNAKRSILFSIDGVEYKKTLIDNDHIRVETTPGKHVFQFFYDKDHYEITTDSLEILPQYRDDYMVYFENSKYPVVIDKPVIYLYPEKEISVHLEVKPKGKMTFMYPAYNNGWDFEAMPDGTLLFGESAYNYLFWESEQFQQLSAEEAHTGYLVKKNEVISFLEEKLTIAGLTSKEQADFITYWGPRLQQNEQSFIHFLFNEECDRFAHLDIQPKPDHTYRIYIVWNEVADQHKSIIHEQTIPHFERDGFTVLEWGGSEYNSFHTEQLKH